jgi:predicted PurR-regulated permease PerM
VLASIIAGEQALGVVGMVIAVPLVTVVKETVRLLVEHRRTLRRMAAPLAGPGGAPPHYVC